MTSSSTSLDNSSIAAGITEKILGTSLKESLRWSRCGWFRLGPEGSRMPTLSRRSRRLKLLRPLFAWSATTLGSYDKILMLVPLGFKTSIRSMLVKWSEKASPMSILVPPRTSSTRRRFSNAWKHSERTHGINVQYERQLRHPDHDQSVEAPNNTYHSCLSSQTCYGGVGGGEGGGGVAEQWRR